MEPLLIWLFVVLFFLSAFFSGTELALMSLAEHKIESLLKQKKYWSKSLKKIKENNDRLLITILIWNNLVNVYTAALATTIAISFWESSGLPQATAVWIATWIVTFLLLLFWEIIPKSFATKNAATISLFVAPIYKVLMLVLYPVITFIEVIIKVFSSDKKVEKMTEWEIESFIDMWREAWTLEKEEHEKIKNILEFSEIDVEEIMTPRVSIEALPLKSTLKKALDYYLSHTHSRIPIYKDSIDKIEYVITWRELLEQINKWNLDHKLSDIDLKDVIKVPINQKISTLFKTFQKAHKVMAIVIDEFWWVAWLVTLEDVVEEVFGEIRDETDKEEDEIKKVTDNEYIVDSELPIDDLLDELGVSFTDIWLDEKEFDWEKVSYLITYKLEWFPEPWEEIVFEISDIESNLVFKVLEIEDHKIWKVRVEKK